ncbi:MAG: hypothetical protein IKB86_01270, partial [Clostridia bacterium]|nr:hypothetical protein [Clostridia bacterium]
MGRVRRLLISCLVVITAMLLLYAVMLFSTNTIYHYVQKVIKQEIIIVDNKDPLSYFSYGNSEPKGFAYSKFDFKRKNV